MSFTPGVVVECVGISDALRSRAPFRRAIKRGIDIVGAVLIGLLTLPLLVPLGLLIRFTSRGSPIFVQPRIGYLAGRFDMYKLRTMVEGADRMEAELARRSHATFFKIENDPRTTGLGRFLRKYSIDEFPQLLNVLRGDMSLVGPRPLLLSDFEKLSRHQQLARFAMKPGITGLWQVSGRSACSDEERMRLDLEYVNGWSLWLDLWILAKTIPAVLLADGAV